MLLIDMMEVFLMQMIIVFFLPLHSLLDKFFFLILGIRTSKVFYIWKEQYSYYLCSVC